MIYGFENFELDTLKAELRKDGADVALEPQVFSLLCLLIENAERLVSKDEIIEKVWDGRIVSDSALASRIKTLRAALGDDGKAQRFIRTAHGQGFRFVAETRNRAAPPSAPDERDVPRPDLSAKPSIAILPFRLVGVAGANAGVADALPDELISVLARLRWLFVIARGTAFRFRPPEQDVVEIGAALGVRYCLTGTIEITGDKIVVAVELAETKNGGVIWGERFSTQIDDIHEIRERIIKEIVAALELHIPMNEANLARLKSPDRLDAWSSYHVGLQHLYRFNVKDNAAALAMFEKAIGAEPGFARAHAGLSCAHFQNAFLRYKPDRGEDAKSARLHAERSMELDPLDPFGNFALGRVHWLEDDIIGGAGWLDRSVSLSPNYAQGIYARAWANAVSGEGAPPLEDIDLALSLSPLDPFRYGMLGVRAFCHIADGDDAAAARWGEQAARAPGAHVLIAAIAVAVHSLNGDEEQAQRWADNVRARKSDLTQADFFEAFPFRREDVRKRLSGALGKYGF
ncbi:MAG: winged helix-turn-helix domain-containing tetratricopeptide repeat protein [Parvularculaceae bacterium]|nr:winged helix-turn-helix domain-containing protein [Parvularculaceae bacterium]